MPEVMQNVPHTWCHIILFLTVPWVSVISLLLQLIVLKLCKILSHLLNKAEKWTNILFYEIIKCKNKFFWLTIINKNLLIPCIPFNQDFQFGSVQLLSRVRLFATPWIAARQASLSITNSRSSLRLASIESVMPSSHLILGRPLLLLPPIPPSISLFQWVSSSHDMAKVLEFQL